MNETIFLDEGLAGRNYVDSRPDPRYPSFQGQGQSQGKVEIVMAKWLEIEENLVEI